MLTSRRMDIAIYLYDRILYLSENVTTVILNNSNEY